MPGVMVRVSWPHILPSLGGRILVAELIRTLMPVTQPVVPSATVPGPTRFGNHRSRLLRGQPPAVSTIRFVMEWKGMPPDGRPHSSMVRLPSQYQGEIMDLLPVLNVMVPDMMVGLPNRAVLIRSAVMELTLLRRIRPVRGDLPQVVLPMFQAMSAMPANVPYAIRMEPTRHGGRGLATK